MKIPFSPRAVAAVAVLAALVVGTWPPWPSRAQAPPLGPVTQTFTTSGSAPIRFGPLRGQNSCAFQSTGAGPTAAQVSNDSATWTPTVITSMAGVVQSQPFTPTSGTTYQITPTTAQYLQIAPDTTWSGQTATITAWCSASIAALPGASGAPGPTGPSGAPGSPGVAPSNVVLLQTSPTPVPQTGYAALSQGLYVGPSPVPTAPGSTPAPAAGYVPAAINVATTGCDGGNPASWGTTGTTVQGVAAELLGLTCSTATQFNVDHTGALGMAGNLNIGKNIIWPNGCQLDYTSDSGSVLNLDGSGCVGWGLFVANNSFLCTQTVGGFTQIISACSTPVPPVANGGTGTAAPSPAASTGCSQSGSFPSQVTSCSGYGAQAVSTPFPVASAATGTTANTYATLVTDTVTLGTSYGPQGKWFGTVTEDLWVALGVLSATQSNYGCIVTASTVTTISRTGNNTAATICSTTTSGNVAGTVLFGATLVASGAGADAHAQWTGTAANGASLTFTCQVAANGTTSITIYGTCPSYWIPI